MYEPHHVISMCVTCAFLFPWYCYRAWSGIDSLLVWLFQSSSRNFWSGDFEDLRSVYEVENLKVVKWEIGTFYSLVKSSDICCLVGCVV